MFCVSLPQLEPGIRADPRPPLQDASCPSRTVDSVARGQYRSKPEGTSAACGRCRTRSPIRNKTSATTRDACDEVLQCGTAFVNVHRRAAQRRALARLGLEVVWSQTCLFVNPGEQSQSDLNIVMEPRARSHASWRALHLCDNVAPLHKGCACRRITASRHVDSARCRRDTRSS